MFAKQKIIISLEIICCTCLFILIGCQAGHKSENPEQWRGLVTQLIDIERIARLDVPTSKLISSYDPTGGNDDNNRYIRKGPKGWWVIADLKGPGYISRFWLTGVEADHGLRLYFDNERRPRIDTTVGEFYEGGKFPAPLSNFEQNCRYTYVPIPYAKRLVIMVREAGMNPAQPGWPKLFYQINYSDLPESKGSGWPARLSKEDEAVINKVREVWSGGRFDELITPARKIESSFVLEPAGKIEIEPIQGPAIIKSLRISLDTANIVSAIARARVLREVVLLIRWDNAELPSVRVPIGDFFGSFRRTTRFNSMYMGMAGDAFFSRFPMPFRSLAGISLENQGAQRIPLKVEIGVTPLENWNENMGYFHSCWNITGEAQKGNPHPILKTEGRGKYAGCILDVSSGDQSWWILEGDETITIDSDIIPGWKGTGLEDYFNSGWYYRNIFVRPLTGLIFKAPFRTVQYRFHLPDPVLFNSYVDMQFERGSAPASRGWMASTAYYYLSGPKESAFSMPPVEQRFQMSDPLEKMTIMVQLLAEERLGDFQGASEHTAEYIERYPDSPYIPLLKLRRIAYMEREKGFPAVKSDYETFMRETTDKNAFQQAKLLMWFNEGKSNALLGAFCNARTKIYIDGKQIGEVDHPEQLAAIPVRITPGKHVIVLESKWSRESAWVQVYLRAHGGNVATGSGWKWARNLGDERHSVDFDDTSWGIVTVCCEGPPERPFVKIVPNGFIGMQSEAYGMNTSDWAIKNDTVVFRKVFDVY